MNQVLKDSVYGMGTQEQVDFLAVLGGMNEEDKTLFQLLHENKPDLFIENKMAIDRKTRSRIENLVRMKLGIAVFRCICFTMDNY